MSSFKEQLQKLRGCKPICSGMNLRRWGEMEVASLEAQLTQEEVYMALFELGHIRHEIAWVHYCILSV